MRRYGVTTVARWLAEELPEGVRSYIEACGTLHELVAIEATSGHLLPRLRVRGLRRMLHVPRATRLAMATPVILSMGENLAGKSLGSISSQVDRAAFGSFALPRSSLEMATV
jgi:hypothetical protein